MVTEQDWHIPYSRDDITLQIALDSIADVRTYQHTTPLMLQLAADEELNKAGKELFSKDLDLQQHDCIQIMLGRGLQLMDEIFTIGFTVASDKKVSTSEQLFYAKYGKKIFEGLGKLTEQEVTVFRDAVRLAYISDCLALDKFDFHPWFEEPISKVRDVIGIETELLLAYYAVEQGRNPNSVASQRLLSRAAQSIAF